MMSMKIQHVEELVGITKKNIRFYESQGLLNPGRAENGYREYHEADVKRLKQIKFLRMLDVSIVEIQKLFRGEIGLGQCLAEHLKELDRRQNDLNEVRSITEQSIALHVDEIEKLDIDACLEEIARSEKEGVRFVNVSQTDVHRKKTAGAVFGALIGIGLMVLILILLLYANAQDPIPPLLLICLLLIPAIVIICVIVALAQRIQQIKGGEEDEASQY